MKLEQAKQIVAALLKAESLFTHDQRVFVMLHLASFLRESDWAGSPIVES